MIKHIVFFNFAEKTDDNVKQVVDALNGLKALIPEIKALEVGVDFNGSERAMDLSLYTEFESKADLETYQANPDHQKVVALIKSLCNESKVVDYEV